MATPALSRFGSDELKRQFLAPTIAGDVVACLGVSEVGAGSDVASIRTAAVPKKGKPDRHAKFKLQNVLNRPMFILKV